MIVYHYCSLDTFYAIGINKTIRLSDITKSNDSMEIMWVTKFIKDIFMNTFDNEKTEYFKKNYPSSVFEELINHYQIDFFDETKRIYSYYVCCFSEIGDVLSQWRGYADDAKGVAIGFDGNLLSSIGYNAKYDPINTQALYFDKVEYSDRAHKQIVKKASEQLIKDLKPIAKKYTIDCVDKIRQESMKPFNSCFLKLFNKAIFIKNPFFKEEKEYRICQWLDNRNNEPQVESIILNSGIHFDKFSFQNRGGKLVSYFDLNFSKSSDEFVKEIVIGPKAKITKSDVKRFLFNNGINIDDSKILYSNGTYR
ncbi:DUF2971 domain-containing protein [Candidatus Clostridium radicumherbarum]|uniref:DUF2971 domain-containing protein n=1 Tax=Candidatus Clostridium radicumherbarum TaxID=3381662 RepID=A0ABW8TQF8_9CLOT